MVICLQLHHICMIGFVYFGFVSPIVDNRRPICFVIIALSEVLFIISTMFVTIYQI